MYLRMNIGSKITSLYKIAKILAKLEATHILCIPKALNVT